MKHFAEVVELADAVDSKSTGCIIRGGSSPPLGTKRKDAAYYGGFLFSYCLLLLPGYTTYVLWLGS